jgi:hypothetical protein
VVQKLQPAGGGDDATYTPTGREKLQPAARNFNRHNSEREVDQPGNVLVCEFKCCVQLTEYYSKGSKNNPQRALKRC